MHYDIKIRGAKEDNGSLEFDRLNQITQSIKEIATKALMLKIRGFSDIKPDPKLKPALALRLQNLTGNKFEGTALLIDCDHFEKTIKNLQLNLYRPTEEILRLSPMALVIQTFRAALVDEEDKDNLDKPLLKTLLKFKKNFLSDNEVFFFSNRQTIPEVEVTRDDFEKIEHLEESIPEPKRIIISGQLDEMKVSKNRLGLLTQNGPVNVFASDSAVIKGIVNYMGRDVTIAGMAHFKPSGQLSYIEVQEYFEPGVKDGFFSKKPASMNVEQQILFQVKGGKKRNPLADITGKWPGDENLDDLLKMLDE
jgi:hypothetical protein